MLVESQSKGKRHIACFHIVLLNGTCCFSQGLQTACACSFFIDSPFVGSKDWLKAIQKVLQRKFRVNIDTGWDTFVRFLDGKLDKAFGARAIHVLRALVCFTQSILRPAGGRQVGIDTITNDLLTAAGSKKCQQAQQKTSFGRGAEIHHGLCQKSDADDENDPCADRQKQIVLVSTKNIVSCSLP